MKFLYFKATFFCFVILLPFLATAQTGATADGNAIKSIQTGVPFLNFTPDARSGALGNAGVALSPDVNANFWNPSKLAFIESDDNVSLSYSPWLRHLVPDVSLSYLSFAHKLDDRNTLGASMRYFNYGSTQLTDNQGNNQGTYTPNEFSIDASLARKFGENFSLGLTFRYIHSNISSISFASGAGQQVNAGNSVAADVSVYYKKPVRQFGKNAVFAFGANISNIGSKISYSKVGPSSFLPANLRIGVANTLNIDDYNQLTATIDFNKLLVPTTPIRDADGNIIAGKNDDVSVPAGIFGSFSDAPGGFEEELKEITLSPALEYWYAQQFAIRAGYFYDNPAKGGRHYVTMGVGLKYNIYRFDFSYLAGSQRDSPLANTLQFTLSVNWGAKK